MGKCYPHIRSYLLRSPSKLLQLFLIKWCRCLLIQKRGCFKWVVCFYSVTYIFLSQNFVLAFKIKYKLLSFHQLPGMPWKNLKGFLCRAVDSFSKLMHRRRAFFHRKLMLRSRNIHIFWFMSILWNLKFVTS